MRKKKKAYFFTSLRAKTCIQVNKWLQNYSFPALIVQGIERKKSPEIWKRRYERNINEKRNETDHFIVLMMCSYEILGWITRTTTHFSCLVPGAIFKNILLVRMWVSSFCEVLGTVIKTAECSFLAPKEFQAEFFLEKEKSSGKQKN